MKIAIVYDWIDKWGGIERVLLDLHSMFPDADFYSSYFDKHKALWAKSMKIHTSFIDKLPNVVKTSRLLSLVLYPYAFESFNFNSYDLVISVTSSFAKAIITKPKTVHICYLLTPTRFLWSHRGDYLGGLAGYFNPYLKYLTDWDKIVSQRPDKIISISQTVADRCRKYYGRESEIIYPPFDVDYWRNIKETIAEKKYQSQALNTKDGYYLIVSRLEAYKQITLAVETFNTLGDNLIIVGKGSQEKKLKHMAKGDIQFIKDIGDEYLGFLYSKAKALIMPQEEDFGYVSLEAQFFGCPVIYYNKGGATETVIDGKTGVSFENQTVESLSDALERFKLISYNLKIAISGLEGRYFDKFSKNEFNKRVSQVIKS